MKKTLILDGDRIDDIPSFYHEINRVFMANEHWNLGHSLDAFDDMLYGAYGAAKGDGPVTLFWRNMARSRDTLGFEATRKFYADKMLHPDVFDVERIVRNLAELESGAGPTFFETVCEIIASHSRFVLEPG